MPLDTNALNALAVRLFEIQALKFGDFKMKVGVNSPVYFDLRVIVSHPTLMKTLADLIVEYMKELKDSNKFKHICGVPYTALPIATLCSAKTERSMLIRRKEAKNYGTRKLIEGQFSAGENCLIVEDVVTSGSSILETLHDLRQVGLVVTDVIVVVDREQGGAANIAEHEVRMHSLFTLSYLLKVLQQAGKIEAATVKAVAKYIENCQIRSDGSFANGETTSVVNELSRPRMPFAARADLTPCAVAKRLFRLMATKHTNLCLAADLTRADDILRLAEETGPLICVLKVHADIVEDFSEHFVKTLGAIALKHNFLVMEDRKFADIGNTAALQYAGGVHKIVEWADLVTVHSLPGQSILKGLKTALSGDKERGVFLLAEMSCPGNLISSAYTTATLKMAFEDKELVAGVVGQSGDAADNPGLILLTPGVKIEEGGDGLGQAYNSPEHVVKEKGADICVVGRGITQAKNPQAAAERYRDLLWDAYMERIKQE